MAMKEITYAQAISDAICEEMDRDPDVFMMGEDIGVYCGPFGVSRGMEEKYGEDRIMCTPIAEQSFVGAAVGAAMVGMRPIVEIMFSDFMTVCFDELVNEAPKMRYMYGGKVKVPMVMRTASGGGSGMAAQHSQSLEACLAHFPGLKVVVHSTPYDAKGLLKTAIRDDNPVMFLEQKLLYNQALIDSVEVNTSGIASRVESYMQMLIDDAGGMITFKREDTYFDCFSFTSSKKSFPVARASAAARC